MAASSKEEAASSPFFERLLKRGFEVLYMTEPVDEYCIQNLPEFEGKKFQNVAKEGLQLDDSEKAKEYKKQLEEDFKPLTEWLNTEFKEQIEKAVVSSRLTDSPSALVSNQYGWSANMERVMRAQAYARADGSDNEHYLKQKKIFEINPYHPLIKKLLTLVKEDENSEDKVNKDQAHDLANVLLDTARLRSGFTLQDSVSFAQRIERMVRASVGVSLDEPVEQEPEFPEDEEVAEEGEEEEIEEGDDDVVTESTGEDDGEITEEVVPATEETHAKDEL
jgi:heat shock protein beta